MRQHKLSDVGTQVYERLQGRNGGAGGTSSDDELAALLSSAEQLQTDAKAAHPDFVAYLAEMTVLQIKHEIAQQADTAA